MSTPKNEPKILPTELYVTEAQNSIKKVEQERVIVDPNDETFAKLLEEAKNEATARKN